MLLSNMKSRNILSAFLEKIKVKHTVSYTNKLYNEHPHKYNLFGLSQMLSDYKIANGGIKVENKDRDLLLLCTPFIAQAGGDFVMVYKINTKDVYYIWKGKAIKVSIDEFKKTWSGIALIAESDKDSIEPNYKENKKNELFKIIQKHLLLLIINTLILLVCFYGGLLKSIGLTILLIINLIGIYISYILILKQIHIQSNNADKICSLFKKSDCNNILESSSAKFLGVISWSEIGFSYFISNIMIVLLLPGQLPFLSIINILALPYSLWSVWYQRIRAKQWCPLCLIVQGLLWSVFIVCILFKFIDVPQLTIFNIVLVGSIYILPYLIINPLLPIIIESKKVENIQYQINSLRMNDFIFIESLKQQPYYEVDKSVSTILFGNPDASTLLTILTNPHCEPCARLHNRMDNLLKEIGNKICIQYVFSSFEKELDDSNRILISAYHNNNSYEVYRDWYESGKNEINEFVKKHNIDYSHPEIEEEFHRHKMWKENSRLSATPTILYNGYELPDMYKIEDLKYFLDIIIDAT